MKAQAFLISDSCFLTGPRNFLQDESQDSPTKLLRVSTYSKCKHNAVSAPKSLRVSTYYKCKHNAVSVRCFYDGLEVRRPQVLLAGSCPSTVWKTSLMSFCLQTQVPVNPEGVFQPSFRWVLKMYVLSSKSLILSYCRIQSVLSNSKYTCCTLVL